VTLAEADPAAGDDHHVGTCTEARRPPTPGTHERGRGRRPPPGTHGCQSQLTSLAAPRPPPPPGTLPEVTREQLIPLPAAGPEGRGWAADRGWVRAEWDAWTGTLCGTRGREGGVAAHGLGVLCAGLGPLAWPRTLSPLALLSLPSPLLSPGIFCPLWVPPPLLRTHLVLALARSSLGPSAFFSSLLFCAQRSATDLNVFLFPAASPLQGGRTGSFASPASS
jgi:hypothetical protein